MRIVRTIALSCFVALAVFQGTLAGECGTGTMRCGEPTRGVNLSGTVLVADVGAGDCIACSTACEQNDQCNVFVWCDNPAGCNNGHGKIYPYKTCTLKRNDNIHAIITDPFSDATLLYALPEHSEGSFYDWVSGFCNICPCCGWCSSAKGCCSTYKYCKDTRQCVGEKVTSKLINNGFSTNCKDPENDIFRPDCVTEPDSCGAVNPLCPSNSDWFDDVGSLASDE